MKDRFRAILAPGPNVGNWPLSIADPLGPPQRLPLTPRPRHGTIPASSRRRMQDLSSLVARTKLQRPRPRTALVARPQLEQRIAQAARVAGRTP